ncbi:MAG: hypothetical protein PGN20_12320 [Agrobacterium cavarae]
MSLLSGKASMPWYDGPTLVETLELATVSLHPDRRLSACPSSASLAQAKASVATKAP